MQNDQSQRQWRSLDIQVNQYPPPDPKLVRQNQREQEPRYEPQPWPHRGLSYPPPQVPEQPYYGPGEQGQNVCSGGYAGESQGTISSYPPPNENSRQAIDSTQRPRVDWLEGVPEVQELLNAPDRRSLRVAESERNAVNPVVPQSSSVPMTAMMPASQRLTLEIPSQERGRVPPGSHDGHARGREPGQMHVTDQTPNVIQQPDRTHRTASMAIRNLIEPSPRDTVDRSPRPPGSIGGGVSELPTYVRRWSAPGATAENAKQPTPDAPAFHVTGTESNYLYATASASTQVPAIDHIPRPRLLPGHYYYDHSAPLSPSSHTRLHRDFEPSYSTSSSTSRDREPSHRVEESASLPPHSHQFEPATSRPATIQLDLDRRVPLSDNQTTLSGSSGPNAQLSASIELQPAAGNYGARREPSTHVHPRAPYRQSLSPRSQVYMPENESHMHESTKSHTYPNPPASHSTYDHLHSSQPGYSKPQGRNAPLFASPYSQPYTSDASSTRQESPRDQLSPTTTSRSSSIATSQYSPAFTLQPTTTPNLAKNLKSTPYYATLKPPTSGSKHTRSQTGSWPFDNAILESPTPSSALLEAPKSLLSSRRKRGSSRPRNPTSTRSMPNLLYMPGTSNPVTDAFSSQRETAISEEPSQMVMAQYFSGTPSGAHTFGTVIPQGSGTDAMMRAPPPSSTFETIMDARLKMVPERTPSKKNAQVSSRGADAWRLHVPPESPRRAKSVENIGGWVSQYPVSGVRDKPGYVRGSRDRSPSRASQPLGAHSSFSQQELETSRILQEMSTGWIEAASAQENIPQRAGLVMPAVSRPASSEHGGGQGVQPTPTVELTIAIETFRNPFVLIDCASALLRYSRSRFFVANGPLMQNNYTELAESINYLGTEMQRIESTFTGQAMQEWINTVYNMEEYRDLERFTRYISKAHNVNKLVA